MTQPRNAFLSSGWSGHSPLRAMAWRLPDVQGDLVIAAFAERYGALGLLALAAAWLAFGRALLYRAQRADRAGSILLASVAALMLVQVLTQVGGALGLLLAWGAAYLATQSSSATRSYGFRKSTILAALANHSKIVRMPLNRARVLNQIKRVSGELQQKLRRKPSRNRLLRRARRLRSEATCRVAGVNEVGWMGDGSSEAQQFAMRISGPIRPVVPEPDASRYLRAGDRMC